MTKICGNFHMMGNGCLGKLTGTINEGSFQEVTEHIPYIRKIIRDGASGNLSIVLEIEDVVSCLSDVIVKGSDLFNPNKVESIFAEKLVLVDGKLMVEYFNAYLKECREEIEVIYI